MMKTTVLNELRQELAEDEGCKYEIYLDHLGLPTFGIGHLVTKEDREYGKEVGTVIEQERVHQVFNLDMAVTIDDCMTLYPDFVHLPDECQKIIANMIVYMGRPRLSKFKDMKAAVDTRDFFAAGEAMIDSRWYTQVPNRARRLVSRMKGLANEDST